MVNEKNLYRVSCSAQIEHQKNKQNGVKKKIVQHFSII